MRVSGCIGVSDVDGTWPKAARPWGGVTMSKSAELETVYLAGADKREGQIYHTDLDCSHGPDNPTRASFGALHEGYRECDFCSGEWQTSTTPDFSIYQAAEDWGDGDE